MVPVETNYIVAVALPSLRPWKESLLAGDRVADVESGSIASDEEAITASAEDIAGSVLGAREEGPELSTGWAGTGVSQDDKTGRPALAVDDGEQRLAAVVLEQEFGRGGGTAPRGADGTAAADILGRQAGEYHVDDLPRQVLEQRRASPVRHRAR
jgi:hypothetical protein